MTSLALPKTKLPVLSERDVTLQVRTYLESRGWLAIRLQSGTVRGVTQGTYISLGAKGLPDWVFVRKWGGYPIHCFVEMKAPGKKLGPDQVAWFAMAERMGLWAIWTDGLEDFIGKYGEGMRR